MIVPGPYGDGMDSKEFVEAVELAQEFFGYEADACVERLNGPMIFKQEMDAHGLDWTYDKGEGAIWDLLTVRATVSSGTPERFREELLDRLLKEYPLKDYPLGGKYVMSLLDYGCGIGREALIALRNGFATIGVDRGKTLQFATFYVNKFMQMDDEDIWFPYDAENYVDVEPGLDVIQCFEYLEHDPDPVKRIENFWDMLKPGGYLICNARSFNAHDTGHLEENFHYQFNFEEIIGTKGFKCLYFPWNPPNIYNIAVWQKVGKDEGEYHGATTESGEW